MKEYRFEVTSKEAGSRIDAFLTRVLQFPRNRVKALLDNGRVQVNRRRVVIAGWELEVHDEIFVRVPNEITPAVFDDAQTTPPKKARPSLHEHSHEEKVRRSAFRHIGKPTLSYKKELALAAEARGETQETQDRTAKRKHPKRTREQHKPRTDDLYVKILHHDKHLIVVDKPAGVLTVPQKGAHHPHMVDHLQVYLRRKFTQARHSFIKPLHRLDGETSGVLVMALSKGGEKLGTQFSKHTIERRYLAIVNGSLERSEGTIDLPLEKGSFEHGRKVRIAPSGKGVPAHTTYHVKERYPNATLIEVSVSTGRTHQIRVHMASLGHPIVGDKLYAAHRETKIPFKRQALHAHVLGFRHPVTNKKMRFQSPLPPDMQQLIDDLRTK